MTLVDLFNKNFLFESKKEDKKSYKIFYKFNINLIKNKEEPEAAPAENPPADATGNPAEVPAENPTPETGAENPAPETTPEAPAENPPAEAPAENPAPETPPEENPFKNAKVEEPEENPFKGVKVSVVTEDDDNEKTEITDDNSIVRKSQGEIVLSADDIDNIQTIDDIIQKLEDTKEDGVPVLDELTAEFLLNIATTNQMQQALKDKINIKDSNVLAEIIYGKKKEESVGVRLIKRKHSDLFTSTMLIDNQIVNSAYNKQKLDSKIVDMRNEEYDSDN